MQGGSINPTKFFMTTTVDWPTLSANDFPLTVSQLRPEEFLSNLSRQAMLHPEPITSQVVQWERLFTPRRSDFNLWYRLPLWVAHKQLYWVYASYIVPFTGWDANVRWQHVHVWYGTVNGDRFWKSGRYIYKIWDVLQTWYKLTVTKTDVFCMSWVFLLLFSLYNSLYTHTILISIFTTVDESQDRVIRSSS
jgi:hypothetical protein